MKYTQQVFLQLYLKPLLYLIYSRDVSDVIIYISTDVDVDVLLILQMWM